MRPRDPGVGRNGFGDWLWQRISAVALVLLLPLPLALVFSVHAGSVDQQAALDILDSLPVRIMHSLLIAALLAHGYIGLKVIVQDYVHHVGLRVSMLGTLLLAMAAFGIWWMAIVWAWGG